MLDVFEITWVPGVYTDECPVFLFVLFRAGGKTPDPKLQVRSYVDVMLEQNLSKEEVRSHPLFSLTWTAVRLHIIKLSGVNHLRRAVVCCSMVWWFTLTFVLFFFLARDPSAAGREGQGRGPESCQRVCSLTSSHKT